ncbi:MAG: hypothetical protein O3B13_23450 [Planctomycetota bacterium]|nr:hypothetical protein [Planctomycetota bacterium]
MMWLRGRSDEELVRRWGQLFPQGKKDRKPLAMTNAWINDRLQRRGRLYGVVFATRRVSINRLAETRGVKKLSNVTGNPD